jgi:hypothetical protein
MLRQAALAVLAGEFADCDAAHVDASRIRAVLQ